MKYTNNKFSKETILILNSSDRNHFNTKMTAESLSSLSTSPIFKISCLKKVMEKKVKFSTISSLIFQGNYFDPKLVGSETFLHQNDR